MTQKELWLRDKALTEIALIKQEEERQAQLRENAIEYYAEHKESVATGATLSLLAHNNTHALFCMLEEEDNPYFIATHKRGYVESFARIKGDFITALRQFAMTADG